MNLPKFSLIESNPTDLPGAGYILHSEEPPYHLGRVVKYGNITDMVTSLANKPNFIQSQITGYAIIISLAGSVEGRIHISAEGPAHLQKLIDDMAKWYYNRYILKNPTKYKQYELSI